MPAVEALRHAIAAEFITGRDERRHNWPDWQLHAHSGPGIAPVVIPPGSGVVSRIVV
jgi:hypothetical protein